MKHTEIDTGGVQMSLFIRLARLTEKAHQDIDKMKEMLSEAERIMAENGARILQSYVILGEHDVLSIVEAPDEKTVAKISALIATQGHFRAETYPAIPVEEFVQSLQKERE